MTKQIILTQGKTALVDDEDFEYLSQWKWFCGLDGYAVRNSPMVNGKQRSLIRMHRQIMNPPNGLYVDHINHNKSDNRRENLRNCTLAENQHNTKRPKNNTTGYKGVSKDRRRFRANIYVDGKQRCLGTFDTPEEAAHVYDVAAVTYFGEFAKINFGV